MRKNFESKELSTLFLQTGVKLAPRILSHQDRNYLSPTFGYFERKHWAWKTFPMADASNQYAVYYLCLLWSIEDAHNKYYHDPGVLEAILCGVERWVSLQKKDGSFDQVFPNEHSFGATAYTVLGIIEVYNTVYEFLSDDLKDKVAHAIKKAGTFLLDNDEEYAVISNHLALFSLAFHKLWIFSRDKRFYNKSKKQLAIIVDNMSDEGWFVEYGGADPGYQSQCLYYLAELLQLNPEESVNSAVKKAVQNFMPYFIHPDGSIGGHYGSRNSTIFYPAGMALLFDICPAAGGILSSLTDGIRNKKSPAPSALDFPNAVRLATNYLRTWQILSLKKEYVASANEYEMPCLRSPFIKEFPEAGLIVANTDTYYSVLSVHKGGGLKVYEKCSKRLVMDDRGYLASFKGKVISTQTSSQNVYTRKGSQFYVKHPFRKVSLKEMTPLKYGVILFLGTFFFRWKVFRELFKKVLVRYLITYKNKQQGDCEKTINFERDHVTIEDRIFPAKGKSMDDLRAGLNYSTVHMASANFYDDCLAGENMLHIEKVAQGGLTIIRRLSFPFKTPVTWHVSEC